MKKEILTTVIILSLVVLMFPLTSAGLFDFLKGSATGKATTSPVDLNISVTSSAPWIYNVEDISAVTLSDGPAPTFIQVTFSVNDSDGAGNLDNGSAQVNLSHSGEPLRFNESCVVTDYAGFNANFTCNVTVWWFDADGAWEIGVNISDLNNNLGVNTTDSVTLNPLTGFVMSPSSLSFAYLTPGTYNQTPSNYLSMNNTGNQDISSGNVQVNATDLLGESTSSQALWAGNFSAGPTSGVSNVCDTGAGTATALVDASFTGITNVVLNRGNFTIEDGTGQEDMYFCLREVGSELSEQFYSTDAKGAWTVRVQ